MKRPPYVQVLLIKYNNQQVRTGRGPVHFLRGLDHKKWGSEWLIKGCVCEQTRDRPKGVATIATLGGKSPGCLRVPGVSTTAAPSSALLRPDGDYGAGVSAGPDGSIPDSSGTVGRVRGGLRSQLRVLLRLSGICCSRARQSFLGLGGRLNCTRSWSRSRNSSRPFMSRVLDTGSVWLTLSM